MGSRSLASVVTPDTIAMNAFIFGYAGHSLVTPHVPLQQIWWTEERIKAKVTKAFVELKLHPDEKTLLERPMAFGDGLTDDTYLDWILEKAKRLFLILAEIGVPDQIFGIIDDSWDDEDLPIPATAVERLALSCRNDEQLNRRFYSTQYTFVLRELHQGAHIDYAPNEVIPLEYVHKLPPAVALQSWSRVHLPDRPNQLFVRRRVSLCEGDIDKATKHEFLSDVESLRNMGHKHIAPVYASYTSDNAGYFITSFVGQHTLKTFIEHRSAPQYMRLPKKERQMLLLSWLHCLADAVATLHSKSISHTAIRPSNVLIDADNAIAFSDIGCQKSLQRDKKVDETEVYSYSPPEMYISTAPLIAISPIGPKKTKSHKISLDSKASSERSMSSSTSRSQGSRGSRGTALSQDFAISPPNTPDIANVISRTATMDMSEQGKPQAAEKSDIFSLGCVFLDILTFLLKKKSAEFTKHRSTKHKGTSRGTSCVDSSYHGNLDKLSSWMDILIFEACKQEDDDVFRATPHIIRLLRAMLAQNPDLRPSAPVVRDRLFDILTSYAGLQELHCGAQRHGAGLPANPGLADVAASMGTDSRLTPTQTKGRARPFRSRIRWVT